MKRILTILTIATCFASCESFVELDAPKTQIITAKVFENDAGARAAVAGIYSQLMSASTFASGGLVGVTTVAGLSADELYNHSTSADRTAIYNNSLTAVNNVPTLWSDMYFTIYQANAILEGIQGSTGVSAEVKDLVIGETLFIRSFAYFYLVNLYGDVPLLLSTDYRVNRAASRAAIVDVYQQIEADLVKSQSLLRADYSFSNDERVEPNKWVATALLARTFLYQKNWSSAESQSTSIINDPQFSLAADLNSVFLANSSETIWQLMPVLPGSNTFDGPYFYGEYGLVDVSVTSSLTDSFEVGDGRLTAWISAGMAGDLSYNFAYKYKSLFADEPLTEYQMVLRLAEQYLIRAEARAMQDNLTEAVEDINVIRSRAGLDPIDATNLSQQQVLDAIMHERRSELFLEWGHRWFDLKRWGKIDEILSAVKPGWQSKDALFPIPQTEINANPNLKQNP